MQTRLGSGSLRLLSFAMLISGATLLLAVGCGGGGGGGGLPSAGAGGDAGDTASGGDGEGGKGSAGKGGGGKGGATSHGGAPGDAGTTGEGGEAGAVDQPPAQNASAVSFMASGAISKSKNFVLISGTGESLGGTIGSKRSKSLKYTYIPGVIAAASN